MATELPRDPGHHVKPVFGWIWPGFLEPAAPPHLSTAGELSTNTKIMRRGHKQPHCEATRLHQSGQMGPGKAWQRHSPGCCTGPAVGD